MAHLSPDGERATLALIADLYAQVVDLREAVATAHAELDQERAGRLEDLRIFEQALTAAPDPDAARPTAEPG